MVERRKNYLFGITPGEWMQAAVLLVALFSGIYAFADNINKQVSKNTEHIEILTKSVPEMRKELGQEIKESEARIQEQQKVQIEQVREDIREVRSDLRKILLSK